MFSNPLPKQIQQIESAMQSFRGGKVTVLLDLSMHDDVPVGFVRQTGNDQQPNGQYERVVEAKNGEVLKKIVLTIPE